MFQSSELIHFLFADPDDRFFRPSGMQLPWQKFIYLELLGAGFTDVRFVSGSGSGRCARGVDGQPDPDWERRWNKQTFGSFIVGEKSAERYDRDCREWLEAALTARDSGRTAIVMDLRLFCELYRDRPALLAPLIALAHDSSRSGILVLRSSLNAADSMELLFGDESVFCCPDDKGRCLCSEVADARTGRIPEAYRALRAYLGDRCVTLNSMFRPMKEAPLEVRRELETLLQCAMIRRGELSFPPEERRQMVNLLYCAIHSRSLQKKLELGPARTYAQLFANLIRDGAWARVWETLRSALYDGGDGMAEAVFSIPAMRAQERDFIEIPGGLVWESARTNTLRTAEIPAWYLQRTSDARFCEAKQRLAFIQNKLMTPWISDLSPALLEHFDRFTEHFREAVSEHDTRIPVYVDSALDCMYFVSELCTRALAAPDAEQICALCSDMLQCARQYAIRQREVYSMDDECSILRALEPNELTTAEKLKLANYRTAAAEADGFYQTLLLLKQKVKNEITRVRSGVSAPQPEPAKAEPEPEPMTAERAKSVLDRKAGAARGYQVKTE